MPLNIHNFWLRLLPSTNAALDTILGFITALPDNFSSQPAIVAFSPKLHYTSFEALITWNLANKMASLLMIRK
jgi:hypothetical protein